MVKVIRPGEQPALIGTHYPPPHDGPCLRRERRRLGDAAGLTQFGVNYCRLVPGEWSSQRHWHSHEDEFIYILEGQVTLVTDAGETILQAGEAAGFKAGDPNGHCLRNDTDQDAVILEVGSRNDQDVADYPDIDMRTTADGKPSIFIHKDGSAYPDVGRHGIETEE